MAKRSHKKIKEVSKVKHPKKEHKVKLSERKVRSQKTSVKKHNILHSSIAGFVVLLILIGGVLLGLFFVDDDQVIEYDGCDDNNDGIVDDKEVEICKLDFPRDEEVAGLGEYIVTQINNQENGKIAIRIDVPSKPRYGDSAPIVVSASTWFVDKYNKDKTEFHLIYNPVDVGAVVVSHLWPGKTDPETGISSEGVYDFGGPDSMAAMRDAIKFALGEIPDIDGKYLHELVSTEVLYDNVGMFASSHAGVVATNVMAYHGEDFTNLKYFVGRENPTMAEMYALEIGHWDERHNRIVNPFYNYLNYDDSSIDYSNLGWIQNSAHPEGRPYYEASYGDNYILDYKGPQIDGKYYFSPGLTQALFDNAFTLETWPDHLATPEETADFWPYREPINNFEAIGQKMPWLKVLIPFSTYDHVQAAQDKLHIRQAYDGFKKRAGLPWVRLNCDLAYTQSEIHSSASLPDFPDNDANTEPDNWYSGAEYWGFGGVLNNEQTARTIPLAGVAEMADRVKFNNWEDNLDEVLYGY